MARKMLTKTQWKRRKKKIKLLFLSMVSLAILMIAGFITGLKDAERGQGGNGLFDLFFPIKKVDNVDVNKIYLTPNKYSRPGIKLKKVKGIVVHYTANPGTTARQNRDYFEGLKDSKITSASSHFIIGIEGEVVQCVPLTEIAYASNRRNIDTVSIECCHKDKSGKFTNETYHSLVVLTAWLCGTYNIRQDHIIRHYDITGKICPKYYVDHPDKWEDFKEDVYAYIKENS